MSDVLDYFRTKEPRFNTVPDEQLTAFIGSKYPAFLQNEEFANDFDSLRFGATKAAMAEVEKEAELPTIGPDTSSFRQRISEHVKGFLEPVIGRSPERIQQLKTEWGEPDASDEEFLANHPNLKNEVYGMLKGQQPIPRTTPEELKGKIAPDVTMTPATEKMLEITAGLQNFAAGIGDFLTSPAGVATLPLAAIEAPAGAAGAGMRAIQAGIRTGLQTTMAVQVPGLVNQAQEAIAKGDVAGATEHLLNAGAALGATYGLSQLGKPELQANAPLTADALARTTELAKPIAAIEEPKAEIKLAIEEVKPIEEKGQKEGQEANVLTPPTAVETPPPTEAPKTEPIVTPSGERMGIVPSPFAGPATHAQPIIDTAFAILGSEATDPLNVKASLQAIAGRSMPRITEANREVGEAGVRWASSAIAAPANADLFAAKVFEGLDLDRREFGAALTEDNLRGVRKEFEDASKAALAEGDQAKADSLQEYASRVTTLIGAKNSPFKTEAQYQDYLNDPTTKEAIARHIEHWNEIIEPQYKAAASIDPDVELPGRGLQTGARINLKAIFEGEGEPRVGTAAGNLTASFKRKTPFARMAKGTAEQYDIDYHSIIGNTFNRQLRIANQNTFNRMLVESGLAIVDKPGQRIEIDGKPARGVPLSRRLIMKDGRVFPAGEELYLRPDLYAEYRNALNADVPFKFGEISKGMDVFTKATLISLVEPTTHLGNLVTALSTRPQAHLLWDTVGKLAGRTDLLPTAARLISKAFTDNKEQFAELATIGAMREQHPQGGIGGKVIAALDKGVRLTLDDAYNSFVKEGLIKPEENTETNRREFVNQVGQYNKLLQDRFTRFLRDSRVGPFATAAKTFNALGVRTMALQAGVEGSGARAKAMFVANQVAGWLGTAGLVAGLNYIFTKSLTGRMGTPFGSVDFGTNDKDNRPQSLAVSRILGYDRALRVTGAKGAIESERRGLTHADAFDAASRDIINAWASPVMGPAVRAATIAATGDEPVVGAGFKPIRAAPPVAPGSGKPQAVANVKEAILRANPIVKSAIDIGQGKEPQQALAEQLPRFTLAPGKSERKVAQFPKAVSMAHLNEYIDYVVTEAKKLPRNERHAKVITMLNDDEVRGSMRIRAMKKINERIKYE